MNRFRFTHDRIDTERLREALADPACGGYTSFEGWVRNHNEGLAVRHLEYEAFEPLALKEGERIIQEAVERFGIGHAQCVHRIGDLPIGEMAVWVGVSARHRHEAFVACRYIIDEVKHRVPIWKKETYENGDSGWVNCERCAAPAAHTGTAGTLADSHAHHHHHPHQHEPAVPARADYSRQMALKEVGVAGQAKLRAARVLVVGCGGLGVPVISYLAGAGVGELTLVDGDCLEPSNLHRQTMYALADAGKPKAELAAARVRALNPEVAVHPQVLRLTAANARPLIEAADLVIDCSDNFATKFLLNDLCVMTGKPVIFASVYQYEGQLQVVRADLGGACLRCIWPEATRDGIVGNCAEAGVLGPVPGIFGSLQALEALKLLADLPGALKGELLVMDLTTLQISRVRTPRAQDCPGHARRASAAQPLDLSAIEVDAATLEAAADEGYTLVDIREPQEVAEHPAPHPQVRHVPMAEVLHGAGLPVPGPVLLLCATGRRSLATAQALRERGALQVYSLRGGLAGLEASALSGSD